MSLSGHMAGAYDNNKIIICGGLGDQRTCLRLASDNEWVPFPELSHKFSNFDMIYMNGTIWTIGRHGFVQYIDPIYGNKWTRVTNQPYHKETCTCSVKLSNNQIIQTGGINREVSK